MYFTFPKTQKCTVIVYFSNNNAIIKAPDGCATKLGPVDNRPSID